MPGVVVHACNSRTSEAEAGGWGDWEYPWPQKFMDRMINKEQSYNRKMKNIDWKII